MHLTLITSWATDVNGGSGTAVFFHALLHGLQARGYTVTVITPQFNTDDYVRVTLERIVFNARLAADSRIQAADVLIGFDFDGFGLVPAHRPPLIASVHAVYADVLSWETGEIATMVRAQAHFDREMMHSADVITIGSQYAKDRVAALYKVEDDKIDVIPHGMYRQEWMELAEVPLTQPPDHPIILAVGKMFPRKRTDILLRAVPLLLDRYPTLEVRIAGDGLMFDEYQRIAGELGIGANVTLLGHVADDAVFADEWRRATVFCHPSSQETFGFVYLEAMQLGKPIVAVRAGAAPEVLGDAARLAIPEDSAALAAELDFFLANPAARADYGERAQGRAKWFTHERMMDGYEAAIQRVLKLRQNA